MKKFMTISMLCLSVIVLASCSGVSNKKNSKEKNDLKANSNHKELADVYSMLADLCKNKVKQGLPEECKSNY